MNVRARLLAGVVAAGLVAAGVVVAQTEQAPQEAQPAADPVAEILRRQEQQEAARRATEALNRTPPSGMAQQQPAQPAETTPDEAPSEEVQLSQAEAEMELGPTSETLEEPAEPPARERRSVAIVQALDKVTAETMRFEVRVGGPPVRFRNTLIFTARACEVSTSSDPQEEAAAYLEIRSQPRGTTQPAQARQVFRGWMFASAPTVNPLEHPNYDAWVVGCRA